MSLVRLLQVPPRISDYGHQLANSSATTAVTSLTSDSKDAQVCPGSKTSTRPHMGIVKLGCSLGSFIS